MQLVLRGRREDRRREPEADGAAGDLEHVDDAAGEALARGGDRRHSRGRRGRVEEPGSDPERDQPGEDPEVAGIVADERQERPADDEPEDPERHDQLGAEPVVERAGDEREDGEGDEERKHPHPRPHGRVVERLLHVLRQVEHRGEEQGGEQADGDGSPNEFAVSREVARQQRVAPHPPLDRDERDEEHGEDEDGQDNPPVAPAPVGRLIEREQEREQRDRERDDPAVVDPFPSVAGVGLVNLPPRHEHGEGGDREVHEEDSAPTDVLGEDAAGERADRLPDPRRSEDQPSRDPRLALRDRGVGHAEDRRPHQRPADAHDGARADQDELVRRGAPDDREHGEDGGPDQEDPFSAEHVREPAAADDQDAEHEGVGVDHPLRRVDVRVEVVLDRRQADVERREVVREDDDAQPESDERHERSARHASGCNQGAVTRSTTLT